MDRRHFLQLTAIGTLMSDAIPSADAQPSQGAGDLDPQNTVFMDIRPGRVVIRLRPDLAPKHVERVKLLCHEHFYDGTPFHRVIDGFMAQGGDPTGSGSGGSKYPDLKAEFSQTAHFLRGTVGAARTQNPDTANSQFYICFAPAPFLDGQYTIWGQVVSGMDFVDQLKKGAGSSGSVSNPDKIIKMRLMAEENS